MMMFIFDMKSAHHLVNSLMMRDVTTDENAGMDTLTEMDMSALNEIGNIVSGSYLNALAGLTGLKMVCSVPSLTVDMVGALLSVPATEFGKYGDKLLLIQSEFGEDDFVTGYFLLIPELDSYDKILSTLGM
jgi:chemotaxis protein CheC